MRLEQVRGTFFQTRGGETLSANAGGSFMNHPKEFAEGLSIGIIMDGNGRWAKQRGLPRTAGHKKGAAVFQDIANYCEELGVSSVYFYAFSTENWKRPLEEVSAIMKLFGEYLLKGFNYKGPQHPHQVPGRPRRRWSPKLQKLMNELRGRLRSQDGHDPEHCRQLRRPPGDRAGRPGSWPRKCKAGGAAAGGHRPRRCMSDAMYTTRPERPGFHPPSLGREAAVQLHALAGCLFRAGRDGCSLA